MTKWDNITDQWSIYGFKEHMTTKRKVNTLINNHFSDTIQIMLQSLPDTFWNLTKLSKLDFAKKQTHSYASKYTCNCVGNQAYKLTWSVKAFQNDMQILLKEELSGVKTTWKLCNDCHQSSDVVPVLAGYFMQTDPAKWTDELLKVEMERLDKDLESNSLLL